jgi:hypothetical protein
VDRRYGLRIYWLRPPLLERVYRFLMSPPERPSSLYRATEACTKAGGRAWWRFDLVE